VDYQLGDTLYRIDWKLGASPQSVMRFPSDLSVCQLWFNPDSLCWQVLTKAQTLSIRMPDDSTASACRSDLWQSSRDGMRWHLVLVDTTACDMEDCNLSAAHIPLTRREPSVSPEELTPSLDDNSPNAEMVYPAIGDEAPEIERYFVPSRTVAHRGVEFGLRWAASEGNVVEPVFLVDRAHGTRQPLRSDAPQSPDEPNESTTMTEGFGELLIFRGSDTPRLIDIATGRDLPLPQSEMGSIMWAPVLHP
jgi:hypothetical protein